MIEFPGRSWTDLLTRLERDLVLRTKSPHHVAGDDLAWQEAHRRIQFYAEVLLRVRADVLPEDIEDIVQAALLKLQSLQVLKRLRSSGSPEGYLVVMIRNAANDLARRRRLERESLARLGLELLLETPAETFEQGDERAANLKRELRLLSPEESALLKMRFWKNLSIRQIANKLDVPYSRVAVRMFRLLRRLRERLSAQR